MRYYKYIVMLCAGIAVLLFIAPHPASAHPNATSGPITITQGGTYSGNWVSTDPAVPAVRVTTSAPVVIQNASVTGPGVLIDAASSPDITLRNVVGTGTSPAAGQVKGEFLKTYNALHVDVEHCDLEGTRGIFINQFTGPSSGGPTITIHDTIFHNIDGRLGDGQGGYQTSNVVPASHAIILDQVQGVANIDIAWNQFINDPYTSRVDDVINLYASSGTSASQVQVHDNYIQGAYATHPDSQSYSGGGIITDDADSAATAATTAFVSVHDNQIVSTTNYGLAIAAGHDNVIFNNRVISSGYLANGTAISAQNVGIYIANFYQEPAAVFFNNHAHGNLVGWVNKKANYAYNGYRNDYYLPDDGGDYSANTGWATTPTLALEQAEYARWQQKVAQQGIVLGVAAAPTIAPVLTATLDAQQHVVLTWGAIAGATTYTLYRATTATGESATPFKTGLVGASFTNTTVTVGTTYYYQLSAVNGVGAGPRSVEVHIAIGKTLTPTVSSPGTAAPAATTTASLTHPTSPSANKSNGGLIVVISLLVSACLLIAVGYLWRRHVQGSGSPATDVDESTATPVSPWGAQGWEQEDAYPDRE